MGGLYEELIEAKSAGNRTLKVVCFLRTSTARSSVAASLQDRTAKDLFAK